MPCEMREYWDSAAATYDQQPDHGLLDPQVRDAWADLLLPVLPPAPARVLDLGCGTGSVAVLLALAGYTVQGVDFSPEMLTAAKAKAAAAGVEVTFAQADAAHPPVAAASVDVVFARHVLWAMPDPDDALARWVTLLRPGGRLLLVEGSWHTGAGLGIAECEALVRRRRADATIRRLDDPVLWGGPIVDERYLLVSRG